MVFLPRHLALRIAAPFTIRLLQVLSSLLLFVMSALASRFPPEWGDPPKMQTRDYRQLPDGYGMGSSTLHGWITRHMEEDAANGIVRPGLEVSPGGQVGGGFNLSPFRKVPQVRNPAAALDSDTGDAGVVVLAEDPVLVVAAEDPEDPVVASASSEHPADRPSTSGVGFADLLGLVASSQLDRLKSLHPALKFVVIPEGAMMTMDVRQDRVRLFVDVDNVIVKVPKIG